VFSGTTRFAYASSLVLIRTLLTSLPILVFGFVTESLLVLLLMHAIVLKLQFNCFIHPHPIIYLH
jgi:hypothetical protein